MPFLQLPDGSYFEVAEGVSPAQGLELARRRFPESFADTSKAEAGPVAAFKSGVRELGANPLIGIGAAIDPEMARRAARAERAAQAETYKPTSWEDVKAAISEQGLGGIGSLGRYTAEQIAGTLPQMGATMAGAAAGGAAGTAVAPFLGPAAPIAPIAGAILGGAGVNIPFYAGSNIQTQIEAQEQAGKEKPLEVGKAFAAATGQATLDSASTMFLFGKLGVGALAGKPLKELVKKPVEELERDMVKEASRSMLGSMGVGAAKGVAVEMPTEVAQQVLQRAQAGLSLTDADARRDYESAAAGGGIVGGLFGGAGGVTGRRAARGDVARVEARKAAEARRAAIEQKTAELSPEQLAEQARVKGMSPEEYFMERIGIPPPKVEPAAGPASIEEAGMQSAAMPPMSAAQKELNDTVEGLRYFSFGQALEPKEVADKLMETPHMANAVLKGDVIIPGIEANERKAIHAELKDQLTDFRKQMDEGLKQTLGRAPTAEERNRKFYEQTDLVAQQREQQAAQEAASLRAMEPQEPTGAQPMEPATPADIEAYRRGELQKPTVAPEPTKLGQGMTERTQRQLLVDATTKLTSQLENLNLDLQRGSALRADELVGPDGTPTLQARKLEAIQKQRDDVAGQLQTIQQRLKGPEAKAEDNLPKIVESYFREGLTREQLGQEEQSLADNRKQGLRQLVELTDKLNVLKEPTTRGAKAEDQLQRDKIVRDIAENTVNQIQASREMNGLAPLEWNGAADMYKRVRDELTKRSLSPGNREPGTAATLTAQRVQQMQDTLTAKRAKMVESNVVEGRQNVFKPGTRDIDRIDSQLARLRNIALTSDKEAQLSRFLQDIIDKGSLTGEKVKPTTAGEATRAARAQEQLGLPGVEPAKGVSKPISGTARMTPAEVENAKRQAEIQDIIKKIKAAPLENPQQRKELIKQLREAQGEPKARMRAEQRGLFEQPKTEVIPEPTVRRRKEKSPEAKALVVEASLESIKETREKILPLRGEYFKAIALEKQSRGEVNAAAAAVEKLGKQATTERRGRTGALETAEKNLKDAEKAHDKNIDNILKLEAQVKDMQSSLPKGAVVKELESTLARLKAEQEARPARAEEVKAKVDAANKSAEEYRKNVARVEKEAAEKRPAREEGAKYEAREFEKPVEKPVREPKYTGAEHEEAAKQHERALSLLASKAGRVASREEKFVEDLTPEQWAKIVDATRERLERDVAARKTGLSTDEANWAKYVQPRMYSAFKEMAKRGDIPDAEDLNWGSLARVIARQSDITDIQPHKKRLELRTGNVEVAAAEKEKVGRAKMTARMRAQIEREKKILGEGENTVYRQGEEATPAKTVAPEEAQKTIDTLQNKLPPEVKFVYAPTEADVPERLRAKMLAEGRDPDTAMPKGAVFNDGTVLVVGSKHTDIKDLEATIAHEIVGHYGIDTLLGKKGVQDLTDQLKKQGILEMATQLGVRDEVLNAAREAKDAGQTESQAATTAVREMLAHVEEMRMSDKMLDRAKRFFKELVGAVRSAMRNSGLLRTAELKDYDLLHLLHESRKAFEDRRLGAYDSGAGNVVFRTGKASYEDAELGAIADKIVARPKNIGDKIKAQILGFRQKVLDVRDPLEKIKEWHEKGVAEGTVRAEDAMLATQMMYDVRMYDQRNHFIANTVSTGPIKLIDSPDGKGKLIETQKGASLKAVAEALASSKEGGDAQARANLFTLYMAGNRAQRVGWDVLNSGLSKAEIAVAEKLVANPLAGFKEAREIYNAYNKGLIDFAVQTGALSKEIGAQLNETKDYTPYYRADKGEVLLELDAGIPIRLGRLKDQPHLQELIGGNTKIMPFFEGALQNTSIMTDLAMRNLATRNTAFALHTFGLGDFVNPASEGPDIIRFKKDGEDRAFKVDSEAAGVPTELLVKGLDGVSSSIPEAVKLMAVPANLLRQFVTRNPLYILRQLVRDPMAAYLSAGANFNPVTAGVKEFIKGVTGNADATLAMRGIVGGNVFAHNEFDNARLLNQMASGKAGWGALMAKADVMAMEADAATRRAAFNSFRKQGASEMEATLQALEMMNFGRHGASNSTRILSTLVPFFNAQLQSLDQLYRSFRGKMPMDQKLDIKGKLLRRGAMFAAASMMYAIGMRDDEAYQNADLGDRYNNWFVRVPGVDEPVKIPIPFELGYIFKAIPEALVNTMMGDETGADAAAGIGKLLWSSVPNFVLPQALKPAVEVYVNKSLYNGNEIETAREQKVEKGERYGQNTSEVAKALAPHFEIAGTEVGLSPKQLEYLVRGYTGGTGAALMKALDLFLPTVGGEAPAKLVSELPIVGTAFQPVDALGKINQLYRDLETVSMKKATFDKLVKEGEIEKAEKYVEQNEEALSMSSMAEKVRRSLSEMRNAEAQIRRDKDMTADEKREALKELRQQQIEFAKDLRSALRG